MAPDLADGSAPPPRRRSPWRKLIAALLVIVALVVFAVGWNVVHYATTPSFADYLAQNPVAEATVAAWLPTGGEVLGADGTWRTGTVDPFAPPTGGERTTWVATTTLRFLRGEAIGSAEVELAATSPNGRDRDGYGVRVRSTFAGKGLHAVVAIALGDSGPLIGPGSAGRGSADIALLLVAGDGANRAVIVRDATAPIAAGLPFSGARSTPGLLFDLLLPHEGLAAEGFCARLSRRVHASAQTVDGGSQGFGIGEATATVSCREHSLAFECEVRCATDGHVGSSYSSKASRTASWNGVLW